MKSFKSCDQVLKRAIDLLSRREHGTAELRRKLRMKGAPSGWIDETVDRLTDAGLLDDERAAFELARWYFSGGQRGRRKVRQLLQQRSFSGALLDEAVTRAWEDLGLDEGACAAESLLRRFPAAREVGLTTRERGRARRFLLGKGYDPSIVHQTLDGGPRLREDESTSAP